MTELRDDWITAAEAAATFAVATTTIRTWVRRSDVPRLGGRRYPVTPYSARHWPTSEHRTRPQLRNRTARL